MANMNVTYGEMTDAEPTLADLTAVLEEEYGFVA